MVSKTDRIVAVNLDKGVKMKSTLMLIAALIFTSSTLFAEEYQAPKVKLKKVDQKKLNVSADVGNLNSGLSYKVEDQPYNDRAVASDEEPKVKSKTGRDPSSKSQVEYDQSGVEMWKFEDIEQHP